VHGITMVHERCHMNIVDRLTKFDNGWRALCDCKAQVHVVDRQERLLCYQGATKSC